VKDDAVRDLARRAGIDVEWENFAGEARKVSPEALGRILKALGLPCDRQSEFDESRRRLESVFGSRAAPPLITASSGEPIPLPGLDPEATQANLVREDGTSEAVTLFRGEDGAPMLGPVSEPGYHQLRLPDRDITLAVAPTRCFTAEDVAPGRRLWGLTAQIYGLRRKGDGGIGDMSAVAALARGAARHGADAVAISPAHAGFAADPGRYSPYAPSSRLFFNPLYADPVAVFGEHRVKQALAAAGLAEQWTRSEAMPLIDWAAAGGAKLVLFRRLFEDFVSTDLSQRSRLADDLGQFRKSGGDALERHARFELLHAARVNDDPTAWNWRSWPAAWQDPSSTAVDQLVAGNDKELLFHVFLQWLAERSIAAAQSEARSAAMRIGLIADLAVGMDSAGSHAWSRPSDVLVGLNIGAPPDLLNIHGQDWGLTTFSPHALTANGFAPFLATLRAAMRHTGGVRIDHVMALRRLWLIPEGASAADGAYLVYPIEDLLRLIRLESHRNRAIVIGEDLGTVPPGFQSRLGRSGIYGMRVMWFERSAEGFKPSEDWSAQAVAMTTTHDLQTVAGWWHGADIDTRRRIGRLSEDEYRKEKSEREADRRALWNAFRETGAAVSPPPPPASTSPAVDAAVRFVAATPSHLAMLPLEDALGLEEQPNLPTTVDEHPNWRRRYPIAADAMFDHPQAQARARWLDARRRRQPIGVPPRATMRFQFHKGFTFEDAVALVPYLQALHVSHVYASPILTARAGSIHGYDVVDPTRVNPELGGEEGLLRLVAALRAAGIGIIVDIVPNHVAVGGGDNAWWLDLLANGRDSRYARFFDVDWQSDDPTLVGKVLVPLLGRPYAETLAAGEITLERVEDGRCVAKYFHHVFPIAATDHELVAGASVGMFDPHTQAGSANLHELLERQHFRLAWWRTADDEINWRRFFDVNELAGLRIEDDEVFEAVHATLFRLYREGVIDGFRIDHVDGLTDPRRYCMRLRERLDALAGQRPGGVPGGPAYLVVEKILGPGEQLPDDWGCDGTTGYDFMNEISALLHDPEGVAALARFWGSISGRTAEFEIEETASRRETLNRSFSAQLEAAVKALHHLARSDLATRDVSRSSIRRALVELLAHMRIYRTYPAASGGSRPSSHFQRAVEAASDACLGRDRDTLQKLAGWLGSDVLAPALRPAQAVALARFQQLSAPLAAKAVEDTAFYRYGPLLSRADVGFDPSRFGDLPETFHANARARLEQFPDAMLATATHDHKRGEDVRARLAVLSEMADEWQTALESWLVRSASLCRIVDGERAPSPGEAAMLFQTMVGAWPLELLPGDAAHGTAYAERLALWQQKALREAKLTTSWQAPNERYEAAAREFVMRIFADDTAAALLDEIATFARRLARPGALNSLTQTLLKLTSPGVPDIYQGTEFWDLSLVDPDNRRPVDYSARIAALPPPPVAQLTPHWRDGRIKQAFIARILSLRRSAPRLFARGDYVPIAADGPLADRIVAFARRGDDLISVTIACRTMSQYLVPGDALGISKSAWKGTRLRLPDACVNVRLRDQLTGSGYLFREASIPIDGILGELPFALLIEQDRFTP
jgi:(1->4)-alpha-D-glucan 1-alpha-D-glucosylmutase